MAEPISSSINLEDVSEVVQEQYFDKYEEQYATRWASPTNKFFQPESTPIVGDGKTMQFERGPSDNVRTQLDPLGNIASPARFDPGEIKIRWNAQNPSSAHDFTQLSARTQFDIYTIENMGKGTIVDAADRVYKQVQQDLDRKMAILRHAGRNAVIALVNGTPRQNNRETFADAAATPSNTAGLRTPVDTGSVAALLPNSRVDFIRPATGAVIAGNVRVTDIPNYADLSVGVEFVSTGPTGERSTGNLASVADNDYIVFSGTYGAGFYSFGAYYSDPAVDESFICGVDRTDAGNRWMIPQRISGGSAKISKTHFNQLSIAMGYFGEDEENPVAFMTGMNVHQTLRDELGEDAFVTYPTDDSRAKRFGNFGSIGLNYQHATFGTVKILADPLARDDRVLVINNSTWKTLWYQWKGLAPIKDGGSHWYRMNQGTPNTGKGLIMAADWVGNACDWCVKPWKNGLIHSITA
jgi:hypothetical protein